MQIATFAGQPPAAAPRGFAVEPDALEALALGAAAGDEDDRLTQADQRRRRAVAEELGLTPLGAILNAERSVAPESRTFARLEGRAAARVRNVEQRTEFRQTLRDVAGREAAARDAADGRAAGGSAAGDAADRNGASLAASDLDSPGSPSGASESRPKSAASSAAPERPASPNSDGSSAPPRALRETHFPSPASVPASSAGDARPPDAAKFAAAPPSASPPGGAVPATAPSPSAAASIAPAQSSSATTGSVVRPTADPAAPAARPPVIGEAPARTTAAAARPLRVKSAAAPTERNLDANIERIVRLIHNRIGRDHSVSTLHLEPDSLGSVRLRMELRAASVALDVRADSDLAHRLLSEHVDDLRQALEASGLRLERIDFQPPAADAAAGDPGSQGDVRSDAGASGRRGDGTPSGESARASHGDAPDASAAVVESVPHAPLLGATRLNVLA